MERKPKILNYPLPLCKYSERHHSGPWDEKPFGSFKHRNDKSDLDFLKGYSGYCVESRLYVGDGAWNRKNILEALAISWSRNNGGMDQCGSNIGGKK